MNSLRRIWLLSSTELPRLITVILTTPTRVTPATRQVSLTDRYGASRSMSDSTIGRSPVTPREHSRSTIMFNVSHREIDSCLIESYDGVATTTMCSTSKNSGLTIGSWRSK
jgi:hypothetical protein